MSDVYRRHVASTLREALDESRVVFLEGPRQCGKTTLVSEVAREFGARYESLDVQLARETAEHDPEGFVEHEGLLVLDEVQRAGEDLLLAVKAHVDRDPRPGSFLLTGSTRFLTVPTISESLAGRVDLVGLWPLSQGELVGVRETFVDRLFAGPESLRELEPGPEDAESLFARVAAGGFPEAVRRSERGQARWFESYFRTVVERDAREIVGVHRPDELSRFARLLATRTATEVNVTALANELQLPRSTLQDYLPLLETVFLCRRLPAWSSNVTSRHVKRPKLHLTDSGLAAHLLGTSADALAEPGARHAGQLLETFVVGELLRQRGWSATWTQPFHYRDRSGPEIDLVLEARDGRVAAVEVKAARSVGNRDLRALRMLRDRLGDAFAAGVLLCNCDEIRPVGDRVTVMPVSALWADGPAG